MILAVTGPDPKEILSDPRAGSQEQLITQLTVMLSSAYAEGTRIFLFNGSEPFGTLAFQTLQNITTDAELTTAFYLPFPDTEQDPTLLSKASFVHWHRTAIPDIPELHAYSDFDKRSGTIVLHYYIEPLPYIPKSVPIVMSDQIPDFIQKLQIAGQTLQELQTLIQQYFPGISFDTKEEPSCVPKP